MTITMFNTNFSFSSAQSEPVVESTEISPYNSRCPSPHQVEFTPDIRSSRTYNGYQYEIHRPRHPSITALTSQLESHNLVDQRLSYAPDDEDEQNSSSMPNAIDQDEGYYEGPDTPSTSSDDFDPTLYDLSMSDLGATSSPRPSLSLEAQAYSSHSMRRRQRQALIRLQCLASRTPDLAMLIEECHPSSLPMPCEVTPRSGSTCSITSGRVEKERRRSSAAVKRLPRMRKRS